MTNNIMEEKEVEARTKRETIALYDLSDKEPRRLTANVSLSAQTEAVWLAARSRTRVVDAASPAAPLRGTTRLLRYGRGTVARDPQTPVRLSIYSCIRRLFRREPSRQRTIEAAFRSFQRSALLQAERGEGQRASQTTAPDHLTPAGSHPR